MKRLLILMLTGIVLLGRARLHVLELFVARWSSTAVPAVRAALRHPRSKRLLRRVRRRVRRRMLRWLCRWLFQLWRRAAAVIGPTVVPSPGPEPYPGGPIH